MIKLIVAYDKKRAIGANNRIPWFIKGELKWVADTTKKVFDTTKINALIMGKNTWLSLPEERRPLAGRLNIVISSTLVIDQENVLVFRSLQEAITYVKEADNIETGFIFGGSSIYQQALDQDMVDQVLATEVDVEVDYIADTFFPELPACFVGLKPEITKYGDDIVARILYAKQKY